MGQRGGRRAGAGRKPKSALEKAIDGNAGRRPLVLAHSGAGPVPVVAGIDEFDAPDDLTMDERHVWLELAPHAFKARTLTKGTSLGFRLLCRNVVLERAIGASVEDRGGANHRGMLQRVEAGLAAFSLRPFGKPIYEAEPEAVPVNPLAKFLTR